MRIAKWDNPKWLDFASNLKKKRGWKCERCGYIGGNLRVHHLAYSDRNRDPWDYHERHLVVICEDCHNKEHNIRTIPDDECMSEEKKKTKVFLPINKRCRSQYRYMCGTTLTPEQAETFCRLSNEIGHLVGKGSTASSTLRFIMEMVSRYYSHNPNWLADYDREKNLLEIKRESIF